MSPIVEEPEDYEEFSDDSQEDNHVPHSTTNGGSNWRGDPYSPRSELFSEAERYTINNGKFEAKDGNIIFNKTREFTIGGGKFSSTGYNHDSDWQRNDPNVRRSEMFTDSSGHTINDGEFTATGNSSAFENTSNFVINGGTFVASNSTSHTSTHHQASMNYGTAHSNAPPRPYYQGQQGYDPRFFPLGYTGIPTQIANQTWQPLRPPATHTRSATFNGPFSNDTGSNPIRTAPIPPSHSEGQGYFYNRGEGRSNTGGGGRKA